MSVQEIRLLGLDVDGVLTDGGMWYSESGDEFKGFDSKDGRGIIELQRAGVPVCIISSGFRHNSITARAGVLGVEYCYVGTEDKLGVLKGWCNEFGIGLEQVAFIGDDINDRTVLEAVGFSACPVDAVEAIRRRVDVILSRPGGRGCVREFIDEHLRGRIPRPTATQE